MDIRINVITENNEFNKACVRLRSIHSLQKCCVEIDTEPEAFDVLQVIFEDKPEHFLIPESLHADDRMYSVAVGMGVGRLFMPEDDHGFLNMIADQVLRVVRQSPLRAGMREDVIAHVEQWRGSLS